MVLRRGQQKHSDNPRARSIVHPCSQPANTQAMPLQEGAGWALAALAEYIGAKGQLALGRKHPKELASVLGLSSAAPFPPASWTRRSKLCQRENS